MTLQEAKESVAFKYFRLCWSKLSERERINHFDEVVEIYANSKVPEWLSKKENLKTLIPSKERIAVSDMGMEILSENCTVVDGQVKGVIVHGAVEKLTDIIMELQSKTE